MSAANSSRAYAISDPRYYERIELGGHSDDLYLLLRDRLGTRAEVDAVGIWARCLAVPLADLPPHGWKLHVSGRPAELADIVAAVLAEFEVRPFSFKCVRSSEIALSQLSRWWPRGGAGKAVTVYPTSADDARDLAERLTTRLARFEGPHILTDRRYPGSRTVQYRYGTFHRPGGVDADGHARSTIVGADGTPWSDDRSPVFRLPAWISADPFRADAADDGDRQSDDFLHRYRVRSVLRHSTAGGIYLATGPDGGDVVLKEARPHTALAPDGSDAVERLHREYAFLRRLDGTGVAPRAHEIAPVWEHTFLAQSKVDGITFQRWLAKNHPLAQNRTDPAYRSRYRERVDGLLAQLESAVWTCLDHGIVYGDMSLTNLMVDDTDTLRLIDFEGCRPCGADPALYPRTTGFAPTDGSGAWRAERDSLRFAIDAVAAACVVPTNTLLALDAGTFGRTLRHNACLLDRPVEPLLSALAVGAPGIADTAADEPSLPELVGEIARHVRSAATPERDDRLFPGDPELFRTNPLSVAHGAAGVLRALRRLDGTVDDKQLAWLTSRLDGAPRLPPGLYPGRAGIAVSLIELGEPERGTDLLRTTASEALSGTLPPGVATGRAGIGFALLAAAHLTGEPHWLELAGHLADTLVDDAQDDGTGLCWPAGDRQPIGYLHGSAGIGTFLTELGVRTGQPRLPRLGRRALEFDLAQGRERPNGGLGFGSYVGTPAFEPYVVRGGAGVGMAVARHLAATGDTRYAEILPRIVRGIGTFSVNPGLFSGMTGIAEFLLDCRDALPDDAAVAEPLRQVVAQLVALRCPSADGTGFPGDGLLRQSCDVATGSAGIALLLQRYSTGGGTRDLRYGSIVGGDA